MKYFLLIISCVIYLSSSAQYKLSGRVIDSISKKPIAGVNIFLSGTSIGVISNEKGDFFIQPIPRGKFELVASSLNYKTYTNLIQTTNITSTVIIPMLPTANILKEVVVESYDTDGWEKWGKYFNDNFIGNSFIVKDCKLLNPDVVKFKFNHKTNIVRAFAHEKLIFENRALGYRINYLLTKFEYNIDANTFKYIGYPLFENLIPKDSVEEKKWNLTRLNTYKGSLMHFIRSLYNNTLQEDGFEVRVMCKITETEKKRVVHLYKKLKSENYNLDKDSLEYFTKVMKLAGDDDEVILNKLLYTDSLIFPIDTLVEHDAAFFEFDNYRHITYLHKKEPYDYTRFLAKRPRKDFITSDINLPNNKGITIFKSGNFFYGENLFINGYWAWSEKLSTMLPYDYKP